MPEFVVVEDMASYMRSWRGITDEHHKLREMYDSLVDSERMRADTKRLAEASKHKHEHQDFVFNPVAPPVISTTYTTAAERRDAMTETYPAYMGLAAVRTGIQANTIFRGHLYVSKFNPSVEATVDLGGLSLSQATGKPVEGDSTPSVNEIVVEGMQSRNRAMHGDTVAVQLLPRAQWWCKTERLYGPSQREKGVDDKERGQGELVPTGRVVHVFERGWRPSVATIELDGGMRRKRFVLCVPLDQRLPKIRIATRQAELLANERLVVHIDEWPCTSKYPSGHYVQRLGEIGAVETEVAAIEVENAIHHPPFTQGQIEALPDRRSRLSDASGATGRESNPYWWTIPASDLVGRRDLRVSHATSVCSIDPPGCEDIDDALSCRVLPNGNYELGVHIADVTHFVAHNSNLDMEARSRGTSVYFVDRRLDMLPLVLSADLCSLRGGTERLAVSVLYEMDKNYNIVKSWFGRTAIYNSFAFSYQEAQRIIDCKGDGEKDRKLSPKGTPLSSEQLAMYPQLQILFDGGRVLKALRKRAGALDLESMEMEFQLGEDRQPIDLVTTPHLDVHNTIEEFMILVRFLTLAAPSFSPRN